MSMLAMEAHRNVGYIAAVIVLTIASVALCENDSSPATENPKDLTNSVTPSTAKGPGTCSTDGHTCYNCTIAPYCVGIPNGFINAGPVNCAELDASKPHCNNGSCSASSAADCKTDQPDSSFICTSNGYFPDPDDCKKFHFCVNDTDTAYICSDGFVYSHANTSCIRRRVSSECPVIKCKYTSLVEYIPYPKDPRVYGLCIRGNPTVMFKCPKGEQFDLKTSKCLFACNKEGLFPVPNDTQKYRECVLVRPGRFDIVERVCPSGSIFDDVRMSCKLV